MQPGNTSKNVFKSTTGSTALSIPITNFYGGGDYTAQVIIGSQNVKANLILDTGSSTLAVKPIVNDPNGYDPTKDTNLKATTLAQLITYGTGGWAGPVVNTSVVMGNGQSEVSLSNAPIAIIDDEQQGNMDGVDGILGLAYTNLDDGYDFSAYLQQKLPSSPFTYPWPFGITDLEAFEASMRPIFQQFNIPDVDVEPYFTDIEQAGLKPNKFAFYTLRSTIEVPSATATDQQIMAVPANQGVFVLGGGEEFTDLYTGSFVDVDVLDDLYYNTNLISVQVDGCNPINALPLQPQYASAGSNSIIDSGTDSLALSTDVYNDIIQSFKQLGGNFYALISAASKQGYIQASKLNLSKWPNIYFTLTGANGSPVKLTCAPSTYWQINAYTFGAAQFAIEPFGSDVNQSILGLPLMNNYYCIFDRSEDVHGVIRFAPIKMP